MYDKEQTMAMKAQASNLNEELGYPSEISSVTVFAGGGFVNVENHGGNTAEAILETIADAMANSGCISLGQSAVILAPEHAEIISRSEFSKDEVKSFLFEHATRSEEKMRRIGKYNKREFKIQGKSQFHKGLSARELMLVVGGGDAGGHSSFIPSWSRTRASLMQSEAIGVCIDC